MKQNNRYSLDPKVKLISIFDFLDGCDFFVNGIFEREKWDCLRRPEPDQVYFKLTNDKLISVLFGHKQNRFFDIEEKLQSIYVAFRDGKTEYELYDSMIETAKAERAKHKRSKKLDDLIFHLEKAKKRLPKFKVTQSSNSISFNDCLVDTGYRLKPGTFKERYVVFDVETNGFRTKLDDLLSLSIYDPQTGMCYNRFFPLDLQPVVLTGFVNGITDEFLEDKTHLTQEELDQIISYFHLDESIILSYSGGQGTFDQSFLKNYCDRHDLNGIDNLQFRNIKNLIPEAPFGSSGRLTKDNLCRLFKIDGVEEMHSSLNDCVLEWKLFEKIHDKKLFFIQNCLFNFKEDYIVPITQAARYPELLEYAGVNLPKLIAYPTRIFELEFPKKDIKKIEKFPTNITGITIENLINSMLGAAKQNNSEFLIENRKKLEFVGSISSDLTKIPIIELTDGTMKSLDNTYNDYIDRINKVTKTISQNISPLISFLKEEIFTNGNIMSQEMVVTDGKVLALCDLSDNKSVVEIKTTRLIERDEFGEHINEFISRQLFFQQGNNRNMYILSVDFKTHPAPAPFFSLVEGLKFVIYKIDFKVFDSDYLSYQPSWIAKLVLKELIEDNTLTLQQLSEKIRLNPRTIQDYIKELKDNNAIAREGSTTIGVWRVLIDEKCKKMPLDKQLKYKTRQESPNYIKAKNSK